MSQPALVYSGFDTLDFAMQGFFPFEVIEKLKIAQKEAKNNNTSTTINLGPDLIPVQVLGGGRKGGYAFQLNRWSCRGDLRSKGLSKHG